ncbi:hypothetical protein Ade02nite_23690 [Paractinoplanes deccanensis]|uniref:XRE family transcriptional regulator n=1 Tax=Paractinoplanes deccanensis TaxID=113561 RepID=A0ABQ3Y197_9ACTN|nr:hypothetical protein [Actinoplanes deccanensis]GID73728.1 hypothetical protein Ade02nite_23690 [Actinoplanes deccanensis]
MSNQPTLLKALLRERHWQKWSTFCKEWDRIAGDLDRDLVGSAPSRSQLARWLAGQVKSLPHPDACRVLEAMFPGLTAAQLFTVGRSAAMPTSVERPAVPVTTPTPSLAMPASDVPSEAARTQEEHASVDGTLGEEIAMSAEEAARFVRQKRGAVDQDVLEQLDADVRKLAGDYLLRPPFTMFRPISQLRTDVFELLDERQRPAVLPGLYRVAGQLCALLAHTCADLGQGYAADTHTRTAWLCADLAEDDQLRSYVRWVQSNVAFWNGDYRRAADLAHSGQRYATMGTSLLRLASQEARAYAAAADHREAERALGTSQAARSHVIPGDDNPGGVFRFAPGKAAYYASEVRLALGGRGNARKAAAEAEQALALFAGQADVDKCPEFVAAAQLDLVASHLALTDLHAAQEHLTPVFALPAESRTLPVVKRMSAIDRTLSGQQFSNAALAAELRERIHLFCAYTATRELPELAN